MDDIVKSSVLLTLVLLSFVGIAYYAMFPLREYRIVNRRESAFIAVVYVVVACTVIHTTCVTETGHSPLDLVYYFGIKDLPVKPAG